jgi:nucleoside-diphosphate-sugar epimerase
MNAVAVTGASGFLGAALCRALAGAGWEVRALVRDPARYVGPPGVRAARCDLPDAIDEDALAGASAVVHCAYATRETDPARARRVNEDGTRRLLEAARRAGVGRMVFISTVAAAPDAPSYYARSKHALERLFDPGRDAIVRPGLIVGRGGHGLFQTLLDNMRGLGVVPLFDGGTQPLQTVHVDDVCAAITRILERDLAGAFNVAEPHPPTLGGFLRMMADRLGRRVRFVRLPFAPVLAGVRVLEALHLPFPLRSESLLGVKGLRQVPVGDDLRRLDLRVRTAAESLADVLPADGAGRLA